MTEQDRLIQRFIDHELTADERVHFLQALDEDAGLRRRLLNAELVIAEAGRLPRIAPSARFVAQVQARLAVPKPSLIERMMSWLTAPRVAQWNMAGALAAACVVAVLAWAVGSAIVKSPQSLPVTAEVKSEPVILVRLILSQPQAASVAVAGDFNGWNPDRTPLQRTDGGMWTATIPLPPGRYQYMFVIDGKQWMADPLAAEDAVDGFGSQNAVLDVTTSL